MDKKTEIFEAWEHSTNGLILKKTHGKLLLK